MEDLNLIKSAQVLKKLLWNIQEEESDVVEYLIKTNYKMPRNLDFSKSIVVFSKNQAYKSLSILGLTTNYNRNTKIGVLHISYLLSVWFNESDIRKDDILRKDVLIIHGSSNCRNLSIIDENLVEIIRVRNSMMKVTWVYIDGLDNVQDGYSSFGYTTDEIQAVKYYDIKDEQNENEQENNNG